LTGSVYIRRYDVDGSLIGYYESQGIMGSGKVLCEVGADTSKYYGDASIQYCLISTKVSDPYFVSFQVVGNSQKVSETSAGHESTACDHDYEWLVENEPTEDETGLLVEKCTKCGSIRASQMMPAIKDDYGRCMYERTKSVLNAKPGQTITVDIGYWDTLPKAFFEALANKRDITVNVKFMYEGKHCEFTIDPAQTIDTSVDYYGPEKLMQLYGAAEVQEK
jgi:hypothetical protein